MQYPNGVIQAQTLHEIEQNSQQPADARKKL